MKPRNQEKDDPALPESVLSKGSLRRRAEAIIVPEIHHPVGISEKHSFYNSSDDKMAGVTANDQEWYFENERSDACTIVEILMVEKWPHAGAGTDTLKHSLVTGLTPSSTIPDSRKTFTSPSCRLITSRPRKKIAPAVSRRDSKMLRGAQLILKSRSSPRS